MLEQQSPQRSIAPPVTRATQSEVQPDESLVDVLTEIDAILTNIQVDAYKVANAIAGTGKVPAGDKTMPTPNGLIEVTMVLRGRLYAVQSDLGRTLIALGSK